MQYVLSLHSRNETPARVLERVEAPETPSVLPTNRKSEAQHGK
jgi:hypothetical protein